MADKKISILKLHKELENASLPVISVRSSGEPIADYSRELTDSERSIAEDIIARHEPEDITFNEQMYISDEYKKYLESMYKYMEMQ